MLSSRPKYFRPRTVCGFITGGFIAGFVGGAQLVLGQGGGFITGGFIAGFVGGARLVLGQGGPSNWRAAPSTPPGDWASASAWARRAR